MKTYVVGNLLEAPRRGASNKYPQHMFSWRNKTNIITFRWKMYLKEHTCNNNSTAEIGNEPGHSNSQFLQDRMCAQ